MDLVVQQGLREHKCESSSGLIGGQLRPRCRDTSSAFNQFEFQRVGPIPLVRNPSAYFTAAGQADRYDLTASASEPIESSVGSQNVAPDLLCNEPVPDTLKRAVKRLVEVCFVGIFQEVQESSSPLSANQDVVGSGKIPEMAGVQREDNRTTL